LETHFFHFDDIHIQIKCVEALAPSDAVGLLEGNDVTGVKVWTGALLLCDYVKKNAERFADKCVLELGSGTGLAGFISRQSLVQ